jgi:hypothetical protein
VFHDALRMYWQSPRSESFHRKFLESFRKFSARFSDRKF